ncbi:kinase-like protein [Pyrenochaeta sp. DS3sAY3a]|nr:kinase-like protein [Pyrenochaeta sp. DS3sAY3a]
MPISSGTYGRVYAAYSTRNIDPALARYAIKEIKVQNSLHLEKVEEEIKILRSLKHPNILILEEEFFDLQKPHVVHLVTRPWAPVTLERILKTSQGTSKNNPQLWWYTTGRVDPWPTVVKECLEGLKFLHTEGTTRGSIKHKDLKPSNILLQEVPDINGVFERNGARFRIRPIIADFGLSKQFVPGGRTDNLGTPAFKSPQQRNNDPESLLDTDIWSLGCCFAFILLQLRYGQTKVDMLWKAVEQAKEHSPFDKNGKLSEILQEACTVTSPKDLVIFQQELHSLVTEMVEPLPDNRPSAENALAKIEEIEAHLRVVNLGLPNIYRSTKYFGKPIKLSLERPHGLPTWANLLKACDVSLGRTMLERLWIYYNIEKQTRLRFFTFILKETGPRSRAIKRRDIPFLWDLALAPSNLSGWTYSEIQYTTLAREWQVEQEKAPNLSLKLGVYVETTLSPFWWIPVMSPAALLAMFAYWIIGNMHPDLLQQSAELRRIVFLFTILTLAKFPLTYYKRAGLESKRANEISIS